MSEEQQPIGHERPKCVSIVVCNEIVEDKWTNNKSLFGLFNAIGAAQLPTQHPRMFILTSMSDGRGTWPVELAVLGPSGQKVFSAQGEATFTNPLEVTDLVVQVLNLPLPEEGGYSVEMVCGGRLIGSRRFQVIRRGAQNASSSGI